jgi:hypothetical protein
VQVGLLGRLVDGENGIDDVGGKALGKAGTELCGKGGPGNRQEKLAVDFAGKLELVEELRESANRCRYEEMEHTLSASFFAISKPSVMMRGCRPSWM